MTARELATEVPERLRSRPTDERGYPIPFTTAVIDGKPDFRVLDEARRQECMTARLCGLCGEKLGYWIAFVGGPRSVDSRAFNDPAMHEECARYALAVCPFLVRDTGRYSGPRAGDAEKGIADSGTHQTERPEKIALYVTRGYEPAVFALTRGQPVGTLLLVADKAKRIEWFGDG